MRWEFVHSSIKTEAVGQARSQGNRRGERKEWKVSDGISPTNLRVSDGIHLDLKDLQG